MLETSDSQFKTFNRCARLWAYQKLLKLSSNESLDNLVLGNAVHAGLEEYVRTREMPKAMTAAMEEVQTGKPNNREWALQVAPAMVQGCVQHWFPWFDARYEFVAVEEWFQNNPHPDVLFRGYKDVVARSRTTGKASLWDWKTASQDDGGYLGAGVASNQQLARYCLDHRKKHGEWPEEAGLVFLQKPKGTDIAKAASEARSTAKNYHHKNIQITPDFASFAISVEQMDVLDSQRMAEYKRLVTEHGIVGMEYIPANFGNCFAYGNLCGFSSGCHSGNPCHRALKAVPK